MERKLMGVKLGLIIVLPNLVMIIQGLGLIEIEDLIGIGGGADLGLLGGGEGLGLILGIEGGGLGAEVMIEDEDRLKII